MLYDGAHEAIVSEQDWQAARRKREESGVKQEKTHSLEHEHILSGILRCPACGAAMYGNVNRKMVDGHRCDYKRQWGEDIIAEVVESVIRQLVQNPKFKDAIRNKISSRIDTGEMEEELATKRKPKGDFWRV